MAADVDVVVLNEDELVAERGIAHQLGDLLQNALARLIEGMGLAGKYELNRTIGIVDHGGEPLHVAKNQIRALVGCKPASETDGEGVGAEHALEALQYFAWLAAALRLIHRSLSDKLDQLGF